MLPLQPDVPGRGDEQKNQNPIPAQQFAKPQARFAIKTAEQTEDRSRIEQAVQAFRHAGERNANPEANEPAAPALPSFVAANRAVNRAGDEGAEDRLRHDDAAEKKSAAATEMDQPGEKTAPRAAEPVANEKSERDGGDRGERDRQANRRGR